MEGKHDLRSFYSFCADLFIPFVQFAEIMLKIEEYISKQPKASEGIVWFKFVYEETAVLIILLLIFFEPIEVTSCSCIKTAHFPSVKSLDMSMNPHHSQLHCIDFDYPLFLSTVLGPVEAAPEYRVIVDANNLTVEIENELSEWKTLAADLG